MIKIEEQDTTTLTEELRESGGSSDEAHYEEFQPSQHQDKLIATAVK